MPSIVDILNIVFFVVVGMVIISAVVGLFKRTWITLVSLGVFVGLVLIFSLTLGTTSTMIMEAEINALPFSLGEQIPDAFDLTINGTVYPISLFNGKTALEDILRALADASGASAEGSADFEAYIFALTINIGRYIAFGLFVLLAWFISGIVTFILRIVNWILTRLSPKKKKIFLLSPIFTAAKTAIALVLMIMPFSAIANTVLIAYNDPNNADIGTAESPMMQQVADFTTQYDQSLLSKLMFSWSKNPTTGKTIDITLMDYIAGQPMGENKVSFLDEISAMTGILKTVASSGVLDQAGDLGNFDWEVFATEAAIDSLFNNLKKSNLVLTGSPLIVSIFLNNESNAMIDPSFIGPMNDELAGADYAAEWTAVQNMLKDLVRAGAFTALLNLMFPPAGADQATKDALEEALYESLMGEEGLPKIRTAFTHFDTSLLLSRLLPAMLATMGMSTDSNNANGYFAQIMPTTYDGFDDYQWGHEIDMVYSSLARAYQADPNFVKVLTGKTSDNTWQDYILAHKETFKEVFGGPVDIGNNLTDVDENGIYQGTLPVMLDSELIMAKIEPLMRYMFKEFNIQNPFALMAFEAKMADMNDDDPGIRRQNYKLGMRDMIEIMLNDTPPDPDTIATIFPIPDSIVVNEDNISTTEDIVVPSSTFTDSGYTIPPEIPVDEEGNIVIPVGTVVDDTGIHLPDGTTITFDSLPTPPSPAHFIPTMKFEYALF